MQLFALIAKVDDGDGGEFEGRRIVKLFLRLQLNREAVEEYLQLFDEYIEIHQLKSGKKDGSRKRTSLNSVKVLRICTHINEELAQKQKIIVLVRLLEYILADENVSEQEFEFVMTVAEAFNIPNEEYELCREFVQSKGDDKPESAQMLLINNSPTNEGQQARHIYSDGLDGEIRVLQIASVNIYILRYYGDHELYLNGQLIDRDRIYVLTNGSSIRSSKVSPVYYSDIISNFLSDEDSKVIVFKADRIEYNFPNGHKGMYELNFAEESGKLVGIMGGSGAGKSTLLNILNGNYKPSKGAVTINGRSIHTQKDDLEGVIGFVSQDDLLIEELTVFQNLYFNAKLCFSDLNNQQIAKLCVKLLNSLGLYEAKDLRVGSPLDKTISGGQRKRLNIALELIREPSVLFLDEPTSGLSSRDSENIMDLLKELALKGKLVFVVIHQPSSDIFKMFDRLLILDQGGYPIYNGNPVEAIIWFKKLVHHVNSDESECATCGNVNPEQIFNVIESQVVDEYGNLTDKRKVSPKEWNTSYLEGNEQDISNFRLEEEKPESTFKVPNLLKQFQVFIVRDVLAKFSNTQYLIVNLFEAPVLAAILSFFIKFYKTKAGEGHEYIFRENENLPQYLFMAVVVSLFIGLTVSAEEIIKDQKILKRESFLNLSRGSYVFSKISVMFMLSAVQSLLFVLVGNYILEIQGMLFRHWLILYSTFCFANMLGLNISASFNSAKVIYILIPFLIIPQLLFSGVIVRFDKLNITFGSQSRVPTIGNIMASRWAYEALAVTQFKDNKYEKHFYRYDQRMRFSNWKKDVWIKQLRNKISEVRRHLKDEAEQEMVARNLLLLKNEITKEMQFLHSFQMEGLEKLVPGEVTREVLKNADDYLLKLFEHYKYLFKDADAKKEDLIGKMTATKEDVALFNELKDDYKNESLEDFVTNKTDVNKYVIENDQLVQKANPIYLQPVTKNPMAAHFYAPIKKVFGNYYDTFWVNIIVLWVMSLMLTITLYFDALKRFLDVMGNINSRIMSLKLFARNKKVRLTSEDEELLDRTEYA